MSAMTAPVQRIEILLIENELAIANSIRAALATPSNASFGVNWVRELSAGLERLGKKGIAAVLLDLALPDSQGIETFEKVFNAAANIPILILGGSVPEALAEEIRSLWGPLWALSCGATSRWPPFGLRPTGFSV